MADILVNTVGPGCEVHIEKREVSETAARVLKALPRTIFPYPYDGPIVGVVEAMAEEVEALQSKLDDLRDDFNRLKRGEG